MILKYQLPGWSDPERSDPWHYIDNVVELVRNYCDVSPEDIERGVRNVGGTTHSAYDDKFVREGGRAVRIEMSRGGSQPPAVLVAARTDVWLLSDDGQTIERIVC